MVTKKREQKQKDKVDGSCWKGLFTYRNFQGEKRPLFAILFKYRHPLLFKLRNQIALNTFSDVSLGLQSLATGAIRKQVCVTPYLLLYKFAIQSQKLK